MECSDLDNVNTVRRRRRINRTVREKTPEPNYRRNVIGQKGAESLIMEANVNDVVEDAGAQMVCMQIRGPRAMSAHESKILRRRDKSFASGASRSQSQPRQAEKLSSPEACRIMHVVKRSVSMPRNKENGESSDGERLPRERTMSPDTRFLSVASNDENSLRLEQNMRKFEQERKRFEVEKRLFERERRDHLLKHRQLYDSEERKRLLQNYRKLSDRFRLPSDSEELMQELVSTSVLQRKTQSPNRCGKKIDRSRHNQTSKYEESSTQFSSSEAETEDIRKQYKHLGAQLSPIRKNGTVLSARSIKGPAPLPPTRQTMDEDDSMVSPVRPRRLSKTVDTTNGESRQANGGTSTELKRDREPLLRQRHGVSRNDKHDLDERDVVIRPDRGRKLSLQRNDQVDGSMGTSFDLPKLKPKMESSGKPKENILRRCASYFTRPKVLIEKAEKEVKVEVEVEAVHDPRNMIEGLIEAIQDEWKGMKADYRAEFDELQRLQRKCACHVILLALLLGFGGLMFRYTEGSAENVYKCEVRKVKRDFIDNLWISSHNMREDEWKALARQKLRKFEEELHNMGEMGIRYFPGQKSWNFVNCILYCWTVITTIGYGHISPKTTLGQALTIIYAIIGIPMFLILLADFGKLFTRAIKFIWGYVRRLYYRGTCRKIRKQQHVQNAMTGFTVAYDMAKRKSSNFLGMSDEKDVESQCERSHVETPSSIYPDTIVVDDEFNLPISLASMLLVGYILIGAFVYTILEDWTYFEAFYFVFISMSTIGFGDLVPNHPIFMMSSILYLILGLALTSMFINVVQIKLSDTFRQASAKIGATIGFGLSSEKGNDDNSQPKTPSDLPSVHGARLNKISEIDNEYSTPLQSLPSMESPASLQEQASDSHEQFIKKPAQLQPPHATDDITNDDEGMPPLLAKEQKSGTVQAVPEDTKKKKKRFF